MVEDAVQASTDAGGGSYADLGINLEQPEITIKDTVFRFGKMLPEEGYAVLELVRRSLGGALAKIPTDASLASSIGVVMSELPVEEVARIRAAMFKHVHFKNRLTAGNFLPVADDIGMAFMDLDAVHIYEVLVRSLARNFTASWREAQSRMAGLKLDSASPGTQT